MYCAAFMRVCNKLKRATFDYVMQINTCKSADLDRRVTNPMLLESTRDGFVLPQHKPMCIRFVGDYNTTILLNA